MSALLNAVDAFLKADAEARVASKVALAFAVDDERATPKMREMFKTALDFYSTPQLAKIVDAKA